MTWSETLRTGLTAIRSHALRSTLTVLGILIGIAAVILTVGLGLGSQKDVSASISSLGSNLLIVTPGSSTDSSGVRGGFGSQLSLTSTDATALASEINAPDVSGVAPEKTVSQSVESSQTNWTTSVVGSTADWLSVRSRSLASGEFLSEADVADAASVIVLGSEAATELFGSTEVVGQSVTISGVDFTVIGVLAEAGRAPRRTSTTWRWHR